MSTVDTLGIGNKYAFLRLAPASLGRGKLTPDRRSLRWDKGAVAKTFGNAGPGGQTRG